MNFGLKVSPKGQPVTSASLQELIVNSSHPQWKCDLRPNPKHFGIVKGPVSLSAGQVQTLLSINHGYTYTPSFIVAWSYPAGDGSLVGNSTYGIGDLEVIVAGGVITFTTRVDDSKLIISADNSANTNAASNLNVKIRYYIFADDFPLYTYAPISL